MIPIILEEPYQFIPPDHGNSWPWCFKRILPGYLRWAWGVHQVEFSGLEHIRKSLQDGHSIILAPNHSRLSDPFVVGMLAWHVPRYFYMMASWHLFKQNALTCFLMRRMGAYSIYREAPDKAAIHETVKNLVDGKRLTVLFPEGVLSRTNDQVFPLREGLGFIARIAARKCAEVHHKVVVHPMGIRYHFMGNALSSGTAVLKRLEARFGQQSLDDLPLHSRYAHLAWRALEERELRIADSVGQGTLQERLQSLQTQLLSPLEQKWLNTVFTDDTASRVKRLRLSIVPALTGKQLSPQARAERWKDLEFIYLAQQLTRYRQGDCDPSQPERLLESIERLEEDLTDKATIHRPWKAKVGIGAAMPVSVEKSAEGEVSFSGELQRRMQSLLDELAPQQKSL